MPMNELSIAHGLLKDPADLRPLLLQIFPAGQGQIPDDCTVVEAVEPPVVDLPLQPCTIEKQFV